MREQRMRAWLQKEVRRAACRRQLAGPACWVHRSWPAAAAAAAATRVALSPAALCNSSARSATLPSPRAPPVAHPSPCPLPRNPPAAPQLCMTEGQARSVLSRCRGLAELDVRLATRRLKQLDKQLGLSRGDAALAVLRRPHLLLPPPAEVVEYALKKRATFRE